MADRRLPLPHGAFLCEFGSLPAVRLSLASGASAVLTLFGAQLVSWTDGCAERLFCSTRSARDGSRAIRGGIPVIFPQFAARGDGVRHGFARLSHWRLAATEVQADVVSVACELGAHDLAEAQRQQWPHAFALTLRVTLRAEALELALTVANCDTQPFSFASALHSYFRLDQLAGTTVAGLRRHAYHDQPDGRRGREMRARLELGGQIDRIYENVGNALALSGGARTLRLTQSGYSDVVVWNPGPDEARALADLDDEEYRHFVCVEAAALAPRTLAPGASWQARHTLEIIA